jgi:hypothetical protein
VLDQHILAHAWLSQLQQVAVKQHLHRRLQQCQQQPESWPWLAAMQCSSWLQQEQQQLMWRLMNGLRARSPSGKPVWQLRLMLEVLLPGTFPPAHLTQTPPAAQSLTSYLRHPLLSLTHPLTPATHPPTHLLSSPGGTRFIGVYLARLLVEQGHEVTLYTRGKKAITYKIADDTDAGYDRFSRSVQHIAGDRKVRGWWKGGVVGFLGAHRGSEKWCRQPCGTVARLPTVLPPLSGPIW